MHGHTILKKKMLLEPLPYSNAMHLPYLVTDICLQADEKCGMRHLVMYIFVVICHFCSKWIFFSGMSIPIRVIHLVACLTTGPKRAVLTVQSRASSFKWEYPLLSLRSSSSFLCLLPHLPVTSIPPFIFPSITCFRRQFLRKMWPIQLAFLLLISCRIFLCSLTLINTSSFLTWSV